MERIASNFGEGRAYVVLLCYDIGLTDNLLPSTIAQTLKHANRPIPKLTDPTPFRIYIRKGQVCLDAMMPNCREQSSVSPYSSYIKCSGVFLCK